MGASVGQKNKKTAGWGCLSLLGLFVLVFLLSQLRAGTGLPKGNTLRYPPPIGSGCKGWDWFHPYVSEMAYVLDGSSAPDVVRLALSSSTDLALYDPATGKVRWCTNHAADAAVMAVSPDRRTIALRAKGNRVELRRVSDGKETLALDGLEEYVFDIDFSPDGKTLAATDGSSLHAWSLEYPGSNDRVLVEQKSAIDEAAFSPDGRALAAGVGAEIRFWNTRDWSPAGAWALPEGAFSENGLFHIMGIQYLPDGQSIIVWEDEGFLVLNASDGKEIYRWMPYSGPQEYLAAFALSPDGKYMAVMGHGYTKGYSGPGRPRPAQNYYWLNLWRTDGWKYLGMASEDQGGVLAFSPDSRSLAADWNGQVYIWDVETVIQTLAEGKVPED